MADEPASRVRPMLAPGSGSPAEASRPENALEGGRYHIYESNPAPWWIALLWAAFLIFGVIYLISNLLR